MRRHQYSPLRAVAVLALAVLVLLLLAGATSGPHGTGAALAAFLVLAILPAAMGAGRLTACDFAPPPQPFVSPLSGRSPPV